MFNEIRKYQIPLILFRELAPVHLGQKWTTNERLAINKNLNVVIASGQDKLMKLGFIVTEECQDVVGGKRSAEARIKYWWVDRLEDAEALLADPNPIALDAAGTPGDQTVINSI
jgi:hypothetical protein